MAPDTLTYSGIVVRIDRPVGFVQRGVGADGKPWERTYTVPYGEILGTEGGDGDQLDVFCGPATDAPLVFWAVQRRRDGTFDEFKLGLGWTTQTAFVAAYKAHIPAALLGRVTVQPIAQGKALLGLDPQERARAMRDVLCDLGQGDVHAPTTQPQTRRKTPTKDRTMATVPWNTPHIGLDGMPGVGPVTPPVPRDKIMDDLTTAARKKLPAKAFALPETRQYPIHDAAHVRAAASRLEANKRNMKPAQYKRARTAIAAAAKRFNIDSIYNKRASDTAAQAPSVSGPMRRKGLHVRIGMGPTGQHQVEIMHAGDAGASTEQVVVMADRTVMTGVEIDMTGVIALEDRAKSMQDFAAAIDATVDGAEAERSALLADAKKLLDEAHAPRWNQIARVGTFKGHPAGPFELTPAVFDQIVRNYTDVDLGQVALDFEHASEADETAGSIPQDGAPAQGWVKALENRAAEGLWGLIEFLEPALTYVREKKYRFFSPAIRFGAKHPETGAPIGARLTSVGIVNRPFLRGLSPLVARDSAPGVTTTMSTEHIPLGDHHQMMKNLRAVMKMDDLASPADMKDKLARLRELCKDAPHADATVMGVSLGDYLHPLRAQMNMSADSTVGEILDAVEEMIDAAMERHEAEFHTMSDIDTTTTTITATDADPAVLLGQAQERLAVAGREKTALLADKTALTNEAASVRLLLRDATAATEKAVADLATANATIVTLRDAEKARADEAITETVNEAFATYKDARKLDDDSKVDMMILARADLVRFKTRYPRVAPALQPLLRDLTGNRTTGSTTSTVPVEPTTGGVSHVDMVRLSERYKAAGMSNEDATTAAYCRAKGKTLPTHIVIPQSVASL